MFNTELNNGTMVQVNYEIFGEEYKTRQLTCEELIVPLVIQKTKYENMAKGYDVILGYIADDRMYRVMKSFFEKEITDVALLNSLSALDLGKQYVAITEKACKQIKIVKEKSLSPLELGILKERSIVRREEGVALTEQVLIKYRREGKFFDEIIGG